jgi:hypothetical protein
MDKVPVNTYLDADDARKLDALKAYFKVDKGATTVRLLIRRNYAELIEPKAKKQTVKQ